MSENDSVVPAGPTGHPDTGDDLDEILALCAQTSTATTYHVLEAASYPDMFIEGVAMVAPGSPRADGRPAGTFAGTAMTLRFLPRRPDLVGVGQDVPVGASPLRIAIESIGPRQVLVVDAGGDTRGGILGDVLSTRVRERGGAGIVVDGAIRDIVGVRDVGIPVFARAVHAAAFMRSLLPADLGRPIRCGGVAVFPGDVIMADPDGVLVIPRAVAAEVLRLSVHKEEDDLLSRRLAGEGYSNEDIYPLTPEMRRRFGRHEEP